MKLNLLLTTLVAIYLFEPLHAEPHNTAISLYNKNDLMNLSSPSMNIMQGKSRKLTVVFMPNDYSETGTLALNCVAPDGTVVFTEEHNETRTFETVSGITTELECTVHGNRIGRTFLSVFVTDKESGTVVWNYTNSSFGYEIVVVQPMTQWKIVVQFGIVVAMAVNVLAFGCRLLWAEVVECFKRPFGIAIGFVCQYGISPTIGYVLGLILDLPSHYSFSLLVMSCVPAGMPSNIVTLRMKGDFNLSIVMTTISNITSFGMTSLWLLTLGNILLQQDYPAARVSIPYTMFCIIIALLTIPLFIGILIKYFHPKLAKRISIVVRALVLLFAVFLLVLAFWEYSWVFGYMNNWRVIVAGAVLPYAACIVSLVLALITRRSRKVSLTIMLEAGLQNAAFAMLIIQASIPPPDNGLAITLPMVFVLFTYIPLLLVVIGRALYDIVKKRKHQATLKTMHSECSSTNLQLKDSPGALTNDGPVATGNALSASTKYDTMGNVSGKENIKVFYKSDSKTVLVSSESEPV